MQFFILLIGVMVFVFFQFNPVPLNFNPNNKIVIEKSINKEVYQNLEKQLSDLSEEKKEFNLLYIDHLNLNYDNPILRKKLTALSNKENDLRDQAKELISKADPKAETNDKDYVFINFILNYLPKGLIGLLLAVILSAAMSSTASGLTALASTTAIDIYKRNLKEEKSDKHYVNATKVFTVFWGIVAILFACIGTLFENLIQLVNIIGSIFYGTVLGIFLVGFYIKYIRAKAIFWGAIITQLMIFYIFYLDIVSFLWLNFIGAIMTIVIATLLQFFLFSDKNESIERIE
jgi:Na+(H+)/acetate symporter ActP